MIQAVDAKAKRSKSTRSKVIRDAVEKALADG
jgi:metal-responsive CopG/Arc/MetJ family transcriptional regulator